MKLAFQVLLIALLLPACSNTPVQGLISPTGTLPATFPSTETIQPTKSPTPIATATLISKKTTAITETRVAELSTEATVTASGATCQSPTSDYHAEISPNGRWIAMMCRGQYGLADSYLQVLSIQGDKNWSINHGDYTKVVEYDTDGMIHPFHWSTDGKYLYVTSPSRMSGCCWIGYNLLLVRLNLETGQQTEIANYISEGGGVVGVDFSISPSDRYVLYIPQDGNNNLYILDLQTWKRRAIKLKFENAGAGFTLMSKDEKKIILVVREYPQEYQGDLTFGSLVLIDVATGSQTKLLSGFEYWDTPIPISWQEENTVLLCNDMCEDSESLSLLNITTRELIEVENP